MILTEIVFIFQPKKISPAVIIVKINYELNTSYIYLFNLSDLI